MKRVLALGLLLLTAASSALGQRMSFAPDAFLKDVDSVAGASKIGAALYAADPDKKARWGDYCGQSRRLAEKGEFRQAIRAAAKALYLGDPGATTSGGAYMTAANDIAMAYSYAGAHATAREWADKTLAAIDKGADQDWVRQQIPVLKASSHQIRGLSLSQIDKHSEATAELRKGLDALPFFGSGMAKSEMRLALASIEIRAARFDRAAEALEPALKESDPVLKRAASRVAGELALAKRDAQAALKYFRQGLGTSSAEKDPFQIVMLQLGLARAHRLAGDADAAAEPLAQALGGLEQLRTSFSSFEMRSALYGNLQNVFDEAVDYY